MHSVTFLAVRVLRKFLLLFDTALAVLFKATGAWPRIRRCVRGKIVRRGGGIVLVDSGNRRIIMNDLSIAAPGVSGRFLRFRKLWRFKYEIPPIHNEKATFIPDELMLVDFCGCLFGKRNALSTYVSVLSLTAADASKAVKLLAGITWRKDVDLWYIHRWALLTQN
jgi:hypothetical protein